MKMKRVSYFIFSLMLVGALSCTKQGSEPVPGGEIRFSADTGVSPLTKADSKDDIEDFAVYGWNTGSADWSSISSLGTPIFTNTQAVKSSDSYVTVGEKKYWEEGKYHFVAYAPYMETSPATFEGAGNSFKLKFANYVTSTSTVDLLYSEFATDKIKSDVIVPLEFKHALSKILFTFAVSDKNNMVSVDSIEIRPVLISLGNFYTKASFTYDGNNPSWTTPTEKGSITNTSVVKSSAGYDAYVLPQTLAEDASFKITYKVVYHATDAEGADTEVVAGPFASSSIKFLDGSVGTWTELKIGKQYTAKVNVNAFNGEIKVAALEVGDWGTASGTIETK